MLNPSYHTMGSAWCLPEVPLALVCVPSQCFISAAAGLGHHRSPSPMEFSVALVASEQSQAGARK